MIEEITPVLFLGQVENQIGDGTTQVYTLSVEHSLTSPPGESSFSIGEDGRPEGGDKHIVLFNRKKNNELLFLRFRWFNTKDGSNGDGVHVVKEEEKTNKKIIISKMDKEGVDNLAQKTTNTECQVCGLPVVVGAYLLTKNNKKTYGIISGTVKKTSELKQLGVVKVRFQVPWDQNTKFDEYTSMDVSIRGDKHVFKLGIFLELLGRYFGGEIEKVIVGEKYYKGTMERYKDSDGKLVLYNNSDKGYRETRPIYSVFFKDTPELLQGLNEFIQENLNLTTGGLFRKKHVRFGDNGGGDDDASTTFSSSRRSSYIN